MPKRSYQQIGELIDDVRALHRKIRSAVSERAAESSNERNELVLSFIEEHERFLDASLRRAGAGGDGKAVLGTWLQFGAGAVAAEAFRGLDDPSRLDDHALVVEVLRAEDALVKLYRVLAGSTDAPRVRAFFESLLEMEDSASRRYAKAKLEAEDI